MTGRAREYFDMSSEPQQPADSSKSVWYIVDVSILKTFVKKLSRCLVVNFFCQDNATSNNNQETKEDGKTAEKQKLVQNLNIWTLITVLFYYLFKVLY